MGEDDEANAKGSKPAAPPVALPTPPGREPLLMSSDFALSHAAMCLKNVVALVAPMLPGSASAAKDASGKDGAMEGLPAKAAPVAGAGAATGAAAAAVSTEKATSAATVAGSKA